MKLLSLTHLCLVTLIACSMGSVAASQLAPTTSSSTQQEAEEKRKEQEAKELAEAESKAKAQASSSSTPKPLCTITMQEGNGSQTAFKFYKQISLPILAELTWHNDYKNFQQKVAQGPISVETYQPSGAIRLLHALESESDQEALKKIASPLVANDYGQLYDAMLRVAEQIRYPLPNSTILPRETWDDLLQFTEIYKKHFMANVQKFFAGNTQIVNVEVLATFMTLHKMFLTAVHEGATFTFRELFENILQQPNLTFENKEAAYTTMANSQRLSFQFDGSDLKHYQQLLKVSDADAATVRRSQFNRDANWYIYEFSENTATTETLHNARYFYETHQGELSPDIAKRLCEAIATEEKRKTAEASEPQVSAPMSTSSQTSAQASTLAVQLSISPWNRISLSFEITKPKNTNPLFWEPYPTEFAANASFIARPDLTTLIAHTVEQEEATIKRYLYEAFDYFHRSSEETLLQVKRYQYWALFIFGDLEMYDDEQTIDRLKTNLKTFEEKYDKEATSANLRVSYQHCLEALVATKNKVQQQFSYDHWLKAFALHFLAKNDYTSLCGDKLFINQQGQTLSLAQWIIHNIQLPEEQKQALLDTDNKAVQKREEQAREKGKREQPADSLSSLALANPRLNAQQNSFTGKCVRFVYRNRKIIGVLGAAAAIYGGYRLYKYVNVNKLARAPGIRA